MSVFRDMPIDLEEIIDMFADRKRRMTFVHPTVRAAETQGIPDMY